MLPCFDVSSTISSRSSVAMPHCLESRLSVATETRAVLFVAMPHSSQCSVLPTHPLSSSRPLFFFLFSPLRTNPSGRYLHQDELGSFGPSPDSDIRLHHLRFAASFVLGLGPSALPCLSLVYAGSTGPHTLPSRQQNDTLLPSQVAYRTHKRTLDSMFHVVRIYFLFFIFSSFFIILFRSILSSFFVVPSSFS